MILLISYHHFPKVTISTFHKQIRVGLWVIDIPNVIWSLRQTPVSIGLYINQSISSPFAMGSAAWFTFLYSSSVYHLLYMSIQRLIGVRCPMRYRNLSYKKVYLHLFFVWCFSTLGSMPVLPGLAVEVIYRPDLFSFLPVLQKTDLSKTGSVLFVLIFISVPFVIMTVLTVITGVTLKRRKRFTNDTLTHNSRNQTVAVGDPESRSNLKNKLKENQGLITLVFLQIGFTGLVVPTFFAVVLDLADVIDCTQSALNFTLLYFSVPSSFVNVFIYIWRDKNFRLFMKRIVKIGTTSNEKTSIMLSTRQ
ncbi:uncharacterized protein LOC143445909 isoform X1 [Clavelina lepadiformis]|uniref:uncharacterized protein LOC143445909 isoform X1 n=1 Tax=Clavelina lepadiformis TaxID=159417 RepID=UPI004043673C